MATDNGSNSHAESSKDRPASIINRGRGPELAGTRITVYRIMDYQGYDYSPSDIATELEITTEQVQLALDYIDRNRADLEADYKLILERVTQSNPPEIDEGRARTLDELQQRVMERRAVEGGHDRPVRQ